MNHPLPNWPRLLSAELAAAYLGISRTTFLGAADGTVWPAPIRHGKRVLWCRRALDQAVDARVGIVAASRPGEGWEDF
jgi:predicted DNA-binding transcriptional regulator AlpA